MYHTFYKPTEFFVPNKKPDNCYLKVIVMREMPRIVLGMHFVGPNAGEVIQGYAAAMKWVIGTLMVLISCNYLLEFIDIINSNISF